MKFAIIVASLLLLMSGPAAHSQDLYDSPYSVYGLGMLHERTSSLNRGMGGSGIALQDERNLNHLNPASYSSIEFPVTHAFEIGGYVESNQYKTTRLYESKTSGGLTNISYWFRFRPWYSSAIGLSPFASVSYNIATKQQLAVSDEGTYLYSGSGNISQLFWGNGFSVVKNLSVGFTVSYLFGSINRDETIFTSDASNILTLNRKTFSNQFELDFGLQYKVALPGRELIVGAVYNSGFTLRGEDDFLLTDINYDTLAEYSGETVEHDLPAKFGGGLALRSKRSVITSDFTFQRWSDVPSAEGDISHRDAWKLSAGYAYEGTEYPENYLDMVGIRLGIHVQEHYLIIKDTPMNAWGATFGISLPVSDGRSLVNITYAYDRLGETSLILHTSQKIQVDIVIRDLWGQRRKIE